MSYLKVSPDLFIGSKELNRLIKSLDEDGFRKLFLSNSIGFGLFNNSIDGEFDNALVQQGTNVGTIKHNEIFGVDNEGNIIYRAATDNIELTDNDEFYWLKVAHAYSPNESYLVSIDQRGNISAPGGSLTDILRGVPNNPVKVSFPNSVSNTGEYSVLEVIDDENAILAGDFIAESELTLAVVGSFTPDVSVPSQSKYPYQYDNCTLTLVLEVVENTPPTLVDGEEFLLARVKRDGAAITVEDKRSLNIYKDKGSYGLSSVALSDNPLIAIESIRYSSLNTPRDRNLVKLAWTFRSSNWTIDSSTNRVTLIAGEGGKFKDTSYFTDGDFDGWRLYTKDGSYGIIKQSSLSATQINLILDTLDVDKFSDIAQQLIVAPNAEGIQIISTGDSAESDGIDLGDQKDAFPINLEFVEIPLVVFEDPTWYNIKYAYKNFKQYSQATALPTDSVGYLVESAFDDNGVLIGSTRFPYTTDSELGFIKLNLASNAYPNRLGSVETGDLYGVDNIEPDNADPIVPFVVGTRFQNVIVDHPTLTLTVDHYFNLRTDTPSTLKAGNNFLIRFKGTYDVDAFSINFTQDYVNPGDPGTSIYQLTAEDITQASQDNLFFRCLFDGTDWTVQRFVSDYGATGYVTSSRNLTAGNGLSGGGDLSADRTFTVNVDGSTIEISSDAIRVKAGGITNSHLAAGVAIANLGFTPPPNTRTITAGSGLTGGGDLSSDRTIDANVDGSTLEVSSDTIRVKDAGITAAKLAAQGAWTAITLNGAGGYVAGARTPQYRIDLFGKVHLRGIISISGSPPAGDHAVSGAAALPIPSQRNDFIGFNDSFGNVRYCYVFTTGTLRADTASGWGGTFILDGSSYWTD